jgi:hypothetical protein
MNSLPVKINRQLSNYRTLPRPIDIYYSSSESGVLCLRTVGKVSSTVRKALEELVRQLVSPHCRLNELERGRISIEPDELTHWHQRCFANTTVYKYSISHATRVVVRNRAPILDRRHNISTSTS